MLALLDWFLEPLSYAFIIRALLAATAVGVVCSVLGT
jgi:ABC-type Mn2+/Zn2+ transport system permease subunit